MNEQSKPHFLRKQFTGVGSLSLVPGYQGNSSNLRLLLTEIDDTNIVGTITCHESMVSEILETHENLFFLLWGWVGEEG